eukprot:715302-Hanusia_phi.AAC.1
MIAGEARLRRSPANPGHGDSDSKPCPVARSARSVANFPTGNPVKLIMALYSPVPPARPGSVAESPQLSSSLSVRAGPAGSLAAASEVPNPTHISGFEPLISNIIL